LFTDGFVDSRNAAGTRIGENAILETLVKNRTKSHPEIVESVFKLIGKHSRGTSSSDDLTLVVLGA
jgi:serine phosphatase RsbU (regulator of sigma subunit)